MLSAIENDALRLNLSALCALRGATHMWIVKAGHVRLLCSCFLNLCHCHVWHSVGWIQCHPECIGIRVVYILT